MNTRTHVAVGVIYNSDKVLITKRTAKQHLAGLWEFPGGKLEENEDVISALSRELYEELGIVVECAEQFTTVSYDYPDKNVLLDVWKVHKWSGEVTNKENQEIAWSRINELNNYKFPEANKHIIQTLALGSIYVISQNSYKDYSRLLSVAEECFAAGIKIFQLRLITKDKYKLGRLTKDLYLMAKERDAKFILNGIPADINNYDINGVHLNSKELGKYSSRPISEEYILGASCHNEEELARAEKLNVNYAFISPVSITTSHLGMTAMGWDNFYKLKKKVSFPVYALGGMTPKDVKVAKSYDAYGVAMIGAIWNSTIAVSSLLTD